MGLFPHTPETRAWFKALASSGGKARAKKLSKAERSAIARKAGQANAARIRSKAKHHVS